MDTPPTGTVTFLFTDIEGSTRLWQAYPSQMKLALAQHDILLREVFTAHKGHVFKTIGDAFCVAFDQAADSIHAILAAQRALLAQVWPAETPIKVRMGVHCGAADERDGDYFGPTVNCTARLMSAAHGGQSLISQAAHELIGDHLPPRTTLQDLGLVRLKDLPRPIQVFQVVHPGLPPTFPPLRGLDSTPNNLPHPVSSFVGREKEIEQVRFLLTSRRLVTLVGPGGVGKSRLAIESTRGLLASFPDGIWLVEAGALPDPNLLPQALASVLCVAETPSSPIDRALADHLRDRTLLLILDNAGREPPATVRLLDSLLKNAPGLRILATSRERLGLAGEQAYPVSPLPLPDPSHLSEPDRMADCGAIQLFVERVRLARPDFELSDTNCEMVAKLCHRLDGMPLPIELAAAQAYSLPVEEIAQRLDDRFRLVSSTASGDLSPERALDSLIDWSYDRLNDSEKAVLRRLSVFAGGWTLEAARSVCAGRGVGAESVSDVLASLAEKRLIFLDIAAKSRRYGMLDSVRAYALHRLQESGEADDVHIAHREYFVDLAEEAVPQLSGPYQEVWLARLDSEEDNLRAALFWNVSDPRGMAGRLRLAGSLWLFWRLRGHLSEGQRWLTQALSGPDGLSQVGTGGMLHWARGHLPADVGKLVEDCQAKLSQMSSRSGVSDLIVDMGRRIEAHSAASALRERLDQGAAQLRKFGSQDTIAGVLARLAGTSSATPAEKPCDPPAALPPAHPDQESMDTIAHTLEEIARAAQSEKQYLRAARLFGAASSLRRPEASPLPSSAPKEFIRFVEEVPREIEPESLALAWQEGARLTWQEAIDLALDGA